MKEFLVKDYLIVMNIGIKSDRIFIEPKDKEFKILYKLIDDLESYDIDSIRICQRHDCNKYFLKLTSKEKRYCSDKCAWIVNARKRRETARNKNDNIT